MSLYSNKNYFDGKMELFSQEKLGVNALNYKRSLDRIIEKYSKLQHEEDAIEVDLNKLNPRSLKYMGKSVAKLDQTEAQSLTDLSDESMRGKYPQPEIRLDFSRADGESDVWNVSLTHISSEEDGGMIRSYASQLPQLSVSMVDLQPEDQDEELEMLLKSNTSLMELYPSMVSQLEWAQHRHKVFEAADSVLRKYRKLWQQPQRRHLNNTSNVSLRRCRPKNMASASSFMDVLPPLQSPLQSQQWSPGRGRSPQRRAQQWPILVRELADSPHNFKPRNCSVNETFNVPVQRESSCSYSVSPTRLHSPAKWLSLPHTARAESYSSPSRQSPFKPRMLLSPESSTRSPKACSPQGVLVRPRSMSGSSSPHRSAAAQKRLFPQDSPLFQSYPLSPQSSIARGHYRLSRHHSFDASLPSSYTSYSAKDLDEDLKMLFHRFVCQSKYSFLNSAPCRYCAKNPEANKNRSSSSLAALALSPLCSPLRKRVSEEGGDSSPGSKRYRHDSYASSPGSKRHTSEMLRRFNVASGYSPRKFW